MLVLPLCPCREAPKKKTTISNDGCERQEQNRAKYWGGEASQRQEQLQERRGCSPCRIFTSDRYERIKTPRGPVLKISRKRCTPGASPLRGGQGILSQQATMPPPAPSWPLACSGDLRDVRGCAVPRLAGCPQSTVHPAQPPLYTSCCEQRGKFCFP